MTYDTVPEGTPGMAQRKKKTGERAGGPVTGGSDRGAGREGGTGAVGVLAWPRGVRGERRTGEVRRGATVHKVRRPIASNKLIVTIVAIV